MTENNLEVAKAVALATELKTRFTTINGYLKGDIQNLENIKELFDRCRSFNIEKLNLLVEVKEKRNLVKRMLLSFLVCLATAFLVVYAGIFDFGKLFPPMNDLAAAIHASSHSNVLFDWILPITITTLILFAVNIIVIGLIVFPIAKMCDSGLANIHRETQSAVSGRQLIHEINTNIMQLGTQYKAVNKIIDGMIETALKNNEQNAVDTLQKTKDDLMAHAIKHHNYYTILMTKLSM